MPEFLRFELTVTDEGPEDAPYDPSNFVVQRFIGLDAISVSNQAEAAVIAARVKGHRVHCRHELLRPVEVLMRKPDGELL